MSPCSSRTQSPSFRSIAGKRITGFVPSFRGASKAREPGIHTLATTTGFRFRPFGAPRNDVVNASRLPLQKIRDQLEPEALALLRMELRARHVVVADHGGDRAALIRIRHQV